MSHAGILFYDGRPIGESYRREFLACLGDTRSVQTRQADGLLVAWSNVLSPATAKTECIRLGADDIFIWDGRLHNRDELRTRVAPFANADRSDATLVGAMLDAEETQAIRAIVGEWNLVLWRRASRTLTLASDYMRHRPLYYSAQSDRVVWASDLSTLAILTPQATGLDAQYIAGFLTLGPPPDRTPYSHIRIVSAAESLVVQANARTTTSTSYWSPGSATIRYRCLDDYAEHLRWIFGEAVRVRLIGDAPVWADLSGGLDSSAVVCMAASLITSKVVSTESLTTYTAYRPDSPESDERRFAAAVREFCGGLEGQEIALGDDVFAADARAAAPVFAQPGRIEAARLMRDAGAHVLLSGRTGDAMMMNMSDNSECLADPLAAAQVGRFVRGVLAWSRGLRQPVMETLRTGILATVAPTYQSERRRRGVGRQLSSADSSLTAGMAALAHAEERRWCFDAQHGTRGQAQLLRGLAHYMQGCALLNGEVGRDIIYSYPFVHRPMVEYLLAVPSEILCRPGQPRWLMRRAFAPFMPERILRRFSKGYASPAWLRGFHARAVGLRSAGVSLQVVRRGFVEPGSLQKRLEAVCNGTCGDLGNLTRIALLEEWLGSLEAKRHAA